MIRAGELYQGWRCAYRTHRLECAIFTGLYDAVSGGFYDFGFLGLLVDLE